MLVLVLNTIINKPINIGKNLAKYEPVMYSPDNPDKRIPSYLKPKVLIPNKIWNSPSNPRIIKDTRIQ